jgi:cobalamin synthase
MARAAATPPAAQRAFPVIMGIAALPVSVWLVAAALLLSEESLAVLVSVAVFVPVAVLSEVETEVVNVAPLVEEAVEAETEAPVVAEELSEPVAVTVTGINAPPGISVIAIFECHEEIVPLSSKVAPQLTLVASYLQLSAMALFQEMISYECGGLSGFLVGLDTHIESMLYARLTVEEPWATVMPS